MQTSGFSSSASHCPSIWPASTRWVVFQIFSQLMSLHNQNTCQGLDALGVTANSYGQAVTGTSCCISVQFSRMGAGDVSVMVNTCADEQLVCKHAVTRTTSQCLTIAAHWENIFFFATKRHGGHLTLIFAWSLFRWLLYCTIVFWWTDKVNLWMNGMFHEKSSFLRKTTWNKLFFQRFLELTLFSLRFQGDIVV